MAEHRFRKAGVVGSTPIFGFTSSPSRRFRDGPAEGRVARCGARSPPATKRGVDVAPLLARALPSPARRLPLFLGRALPVVVNGWCVAMVGVVAGVVLVVVRLVVVVSEETWAAARPGGVWARASLWRSPRR